MLNTPNPIFVFAQRGAEKWLNRVLNNLAPIKSMYCWTKSVHTRQMRPYDFLTLNMLNNIPTFNRMLHKRQSNRYDDVEWKFEGNGDMGYRVDMFDAADRITDARIEDENLRREVKSSNRRKRLILEERFDVGPGLVGVEKPKPIERFTDRPESTTKEHDYTYLKVLENRAYSVTRFMLDNKNYNGYSGNWKLLEKNLKGGKMTFNRLKDSDADIAYVINKGDEINFRLRDKDRYMPINIYQYVLYHEMAHMSTTELQHTETFYKLMSIIVLAAFEMGLIDIRRQTTGLFETNGQPISDKGSIKNEIINGANLLKKEIINGAYYDSLILHVERV